MELRDIMVANTEDQSRKVIKSSAETLGELKRDFDANGIHYEGLDITEGISKTVLIDDSSQLPKDINYKGSNTNNLVIILTRTKKKISSGAMQGKRGDYYEIIKANGLQDGIKTKYGDNYTRVSTPLLYDYLEENGYLEKGSQEAAALEDDPQKPTCGGYNDEKYYHDEEEQPDSNVGLDPVSSCYHVVELLVNSHALSPANLDNLVSMLQTLLDRVKGNANPKMLVGGTTITSDDVDAMIAEMS